MNFSITKKQFLLILSAAYALFQISETTLASPYLWRVTSTKTIQARSFHILGTQHNIPEDELDDLVSVIARMDNTVFVSEIGSSSESYGFTNENLSTFGLILDSSSWASALKDSLTEEEFNSLDRDLSIVFPDVNWRNIHPALISDLVSSWSIGHSYRNGMDLSLRSFADVHGTTHIALENTFTRHNISGKIESFAKEDIGLKQRKIARDYKVLYLKGSTENIKALFSRDSEHEYLLGRSCFLDCTKDSQVQMRNLSWIPRILEALSENPTSNIFMYVGVGHMYGRLGLLTLLKNEGFVLERCHELGFASIHSSRLVSKTPAPNEAQRQEIFNPINYFHHSESESKKSLTYKDFLLWIAKKSLVKRKLVTTSTSINTEEAANVLSQIAMEQDLKAYQSDCWRGSLSRDSKKLIDIDIGYLFATSPSDQQYLLIMQKALKIRRPESIGSESKHSERAHTEEEKKFEDIPSNDTETNKTPLSGREILDIEDDFDFFNACLQQYLLSSHEVSILCSKSHGTIYRRLKRVVERIYSNTSLETSSLEINRRRCGAEACPQRAFVTDLTYALNLLLLSAYYYDKDESTGHSW